MTGHPRTCEPSLALFEAIQDHLDGLDVVEIGCVYLQRACPGPDHSGPWLAGIPSNPREESMNGMLGTV